MMFPRYYHESEARCFACGSALHDVRDSHYPIGRKVGTCACGYDTWFDKVTCHTDTNTEHRGVTGTVGQRNGMARRMQ